MIHERLDLDRWVSAFPLSGMNKSTDFNCSITGPLHVAYVEQIRSAVRKAGGDLGRAVPVDLCVWNAGESPRREATKIGGVPYWTASEPWPTTIDGIPFTFVAQFCFADSQDILPQLNGNVLSILALESDYQHLEICWHALDDELLPEDEIPAPRWTIAPCHAVLHRTMEYPDANYELFEAFPFPLKSWCSDFWNASKLGGIWRMRGELPDPADVEDPDYRRLIEAAWEEARLCERTFFGQLASIEVNKRQPFLNMEHGNPFAQDFLMIADVGGYDLFYDGKDTTSGWWSG